MRNYESIIMRVRQIKVAGILSMVRPVQLRHSQKNVEEGLYLN
jgi:hypothetical protein